MRSEREGGKKVYLITSGEYSDYGVSCAFSTREAAERYVARQQEAGPLRPDGSFVSAEAWCRIEEFPLDDEPVPMLGVFRAECSWPPLGSPWGPGRTRFPVQEGRRVAADDDFTACGDYVKANYPLTDVPTWDFIFVRDTLTEAILAANNLLRAFHAGTMTTDAMTLPKYELPPPRGDAA